jgi:hypothetical protein
MSANINTLRPQYHKVHWIRYRTIFNLEGIQIMWSVVCIKNYGIGELKVLFRNF